MSDEPQRKQLRLQGYDYREDGVYFVTICTDQREMLFGNVVDEVVALNELGEIVCQCWEALPTHFPYVQLDAFVVMPNHIHLIIVINQYALRERHASPLQKPASDAKSLGVIIGSFKSAAAKRINEQRNTAGAPLWQRGYYDRIVRNERELKAFREYILYNPSRWANDENNLSK